METACKERSGDNCRVDTTENNIGNSSQSSAIVPNSNVIEEIGEDLSLFDNEKIEEIGQDLPLFDNEKTTNITVVGTPPPPQAGLKLLHKAPRVGLSRQQKLTRLHPYKKQ